ncbi:MAG: response regulator, partial [Woeseiaceae bacterium]
STFTVTLPASSTRKKRTQKPSRQKRDNEQGEILVIDDDPAVRDLVSRYLIKEGFGVRTASSGEEGLEIARRVNPDAITLDLLMPGVDGWSVLTQLKADPELANIPVVIVTILDNKDMGYTLGAADYLTKPIDQQRLVSIIRQHCGKRARAPILVVEDDADSRRLLCSMLKKEGWEVVEVEDAESALARVTRQEPAMILLDLILPGMDGFQFIEAINENRAWRKIPIVVVTAKDLSPDEHRFLNRSVQKIIKKGVYNRSELLDLVRTTMRANVAREEGAMH